MDFNENYIDCIKNWKTISDVEVESCKEYIKTLCDVPFDKISVINHSVHIYLIILMKNGQINKQHFLVVDTKKILYAKCDENYTHFQGID